MDIAFESGARGRHIINVSIRFSMYHILTYTYVLKNFYISSRFTLCHHISKLEVDIKVDIILCAIGLAQRS